MLACLSTSKGFSPNIENTAQYIRDLQIKLVCSEQKYTRASIEENEWMLVQEQREFWQVATPLDQFKA